MTSERERAANLVAAEEKAEHLFAEVARRGLVAAGEWESDVRTASAIWAPSCSARTGTGTNGSSAPAEHAAAHFAALPDITGAELYAHVVGPAEATGWEFGGWHSGHLVGEFPHELVDGDSVHSYIAPGSDGPMRRTDQAGRASHWILEVHLVDRARQIGGFHEQLLTLR